MPTRSTGSSIEAHFSKTYFKERGFGKVGFYTKITYFFLHSSALPLKKLLWTTSGTLCYFGSISLLLLAYCVFIA
jgi:hypothetical protein